MVDLELLRLIERFGKLSEELGELRTTILQHVRLLALIKGQQTTDEIPDLSDVGSSFRPLRALRRRRVVGQSRRDYIIEWGRSHETFTSAEVAQATSTKLTSIRSMFSNMKAEGILVTAGDGKWMLRPQAEQERKIS